MVMARLRTCRATEALVGGASTKAGCGLNGRMVLARTAGSGRDGGSTPSARAAFQPQRGSSRKARACAVQSASPEATMRSACSGSVMTPTAQVLMPASLRMRAANGTW